MNLILGIDTGGTYTDGVLFDYAEQRVIRKVKVFTTKKDLAVGIADCIRQLEIDADDDVCLVCLSTTLATNAVVEGIETSVGLITIGDKSVEKKKYPAAVVRNIEGGMDIMGNQTIPLNYTQIENTVRDMKGKISALAISGYASVRNPQHELEVRSAAEKILGVPIVCAYELTNTLGFYERTVTAVWNARLIRLIESLFDDVSKALKENRITAPLYVVKGDGHLIPEQIARCRPVETVLSGPAAGMTGGCCLGSKNNCLIVDIGGTTTDVVFVNNGEVTIDSKGASVGGWHTRVEAVQTYSVGLGGDSYIRIDMSHHIQIGPQKVIPLCVAAEKYPYLMKELDMAKEKTPYMIFERQDCDCVILYKDKNKFSNLLNTRDRRILELLADGPHSLFYLAEAMCSDIDGLNLKMLLKLELVQLISFTPTDILHCLGECRRWNRKASLLAAQLLGAHLGMDGIELARYAEQKFVYELGKTLIASVLESDGIGISDDSEHRKYLNYLAENILGRKKSNHFDFSGNLSIPVIGIGAPAGNWIRKVADLLGAECIIPEHSEVASAVGAAVSNVKEVVQSFIYYDGFLKRYIVFTSQGKAEFEDLEDAREFGKRSIQLLAENIAKVFCISESDVTIEEKNESIQNIIDGKKSFQRVVQTAVFTGNII